MTAPAICALSGVEKRFGGVVALAGVDLEVHPGRVHAIVGENGAGKSTLMKIIAGAETPDAGGVAVNGVDVHFDSVKVANDHGVAIVFQELSLYGELDVLANLFMQRESTRLGLIQRAEMRRRARPILDELGLDVDLEMPAGQLTLSEQQLVEIAKALLAEANVLILDEPNSALNAAETERLFDIVRGLRDRGVAVLFISHRLEEVFEIADVITVMRNGRVVTTMPLAGATIPDVIAMMIGRQYTEATPSASHADHDSPALRLQGLTVPGQVEDVTLTVAPGEVLGLAGLEGSGVTAVLEAVFGMSRPSAGTIVLPDGQPAPHSIRDSVRAGIAMVPADRRHDGLMLSADLLTNIAQVTAGTLGRFGFFLRRGQMEERASVRMRDLDIVAGSVRSPVNELSGGNQQKVVIAKWLEADPRVVLLNDPTRGVDVGAKEEIYEIVRGLAAERRIVLFTSTELPEYVHLCDRVVVFYRGRVCGELGREEIDTHVLLEAINTGDIGAAAGERRVDDDASKNSEEVGS
ncbi:MAG: sugar ABC transporter ATP-binding protein [Candidatus Limnocylindrales bacterium]